MFNCPEVVLPSSKLPDEISPYEALKGKQPDVSKFKTWGCTAWHHLHDHERKNKVSPVAVPSIHLGFDPQRNGYIIFLPHQNKITSSYHLTFQESRFMKFKDNEIRDIPPDINPLDDITPLYREGKRKIGIMVWLRILMRRGMIRMSWDTTCLVT